MVRTLSRRCPVPELLPEDPTENEDCQKTPFLFSFNKAKRSLRCLHKTQLKGYHTEGRVLRTGKCPKPFLRESVQLHGWPTLSLFYREKSANEV